MGGGAWGWGRDEAGKEVREPDTPDDSTTKTRTETPAWQVREASSWGTRHTQQRTTKQEGRREGGRAKVSRVEIDLRSF